MATTVNLEISLETLVQAIHSLDLQAKHQLLEILEQQIFEAEEAEYEEDEHGKAEIAAVQSEYNRGEFTLDVQQSTKSASSQILEAIAALPMEGKTDEFSGQDHDQVLYSDRSIVDCRFGILAKEGAIALKSRHSATKEIP